MESLARKAGSPGASPAAPKMNVGRRKGFRWVTCSASSDEAGRKALLFPASPQRIIKLDQCQPLVKLRLRQVQFRGKRVGFAG